MPVVHPSIGCVVLVSFPFSDLTANKLRPAAVLFQSSLEDWVLCQITSKKYGDVGAIEIAQKDLASGSLNAISYARPSKIFTAHLSIIDQVVATLANDKRNEILDAVIKRLQSSRI